MKDGRKIRIRPAISDKGNFQCTTFEPTQLGSRVPVIGRVEPKGGGGNMDKGPVYIFTILGPWNSSKPL